MPSLREQVWSLGVCKGFVCRWRWTLPQAEASADAQEGGQGVVLLQEVIKKINKKKAFWYFNRKLRWASCWQSKQRDARNNLALWCRFYVVRDYEDLWLQTSGQKLKLKEYNEARWCYQATLMPVNRHFAKSSLSCFVDYAVAYLTLTDTLWTPFSLHLSLSLPLFL